MPASGVAELGAWVALTAYAYTAGGVREASAVMVAQLVPATAFALAVGAFIRRYGAGAVLKWGLASQSAAMLATAAFLHQGQTPAPLLQPSWPRRRSSRRALLNQS